MPGPLGFLFDDPEATASAQASTAMAPGVMDYLRRMLSGQIAAENLPRSYYDPCRREPRCHPMSTGAAP